MRLVVAPNPVSNHGKGEVFKGVPLVRRQLEQPPRQCVVVLSLVRGVVAGGKLKVLVLILQEIVLQLVCKAKRACFKGNKREMIICT